jgi:hypothetical protein
MLMKTHIKQAIALGLLAAGTLASTTTQAADYQPAPRPYLPVDIKVTGDNTGAAREFPFQGNSNYYRAYIQANPNERYRIRVTNNSNDRVGLVLAVDGRNIVSGQKSYLGNGERMYILGPHQSASYEGWRTSQNQTNRFFFTSAANSYAGAWGDNSAMGVIAMAVYAEVPHPTVMPYSYNSSEASADSARAAPRAGAARPSARPSARVAPAPGTGYGEGHYSPSYNVEFAAQSSPMQKVFLKYEWRQTLCQMKALPECRTTRPRQPTNRFWPDNREYAPPPPRHHYR